jgi:hypothetical protein
VITVAICREREDEDERVRKGEQTAGMIRHLREL